MNKLSEEEKKRRKKEYDAKRYQENREKRLEQSAKWRAENPDYYAKWKAKYRETPMGRAVNLVNHYQRDDKKHNRGECTLTAKWIVDNIFSKPCNYCGKEGWKIMGCDRIDNSLPHTPDNVVPCCAECNRKRHLKTYEEFKNEMEG